MITRDEQREVREWLKRKAAGDNTSDAMHAILALAWIAEMGSPFIDKVKAKEDDDAMIQIRFRAKRATVSISELPDETQD